VKRPGRDKPIQIVIHMCMEAKLGISLYNYLYLKLAKMLCLSYYHLCFLFNKSGEEGVGEGEEVEGQWEEMAQCIHI
jgi:hypothetical protein